MVLLQIKIVKFVPDNDEISKPATDRLIFPDTVMLLSSNEPSGSATVRSLIVLLLPLALP